MKGVGAAGAAAAAAAAAAEAEPAPRKSGLPPGRRGGAMTKEERDNAEAQKELEILPNVVISLSSADFRVRLMSHTSHGTEEHVTRHTSHVTRHRFEAKV